MHTNYLRQTKSITGLGQCVDGANMQTQKKDSSLMNVRVEQVVREQFLKSCKDQDTTAAREIRQFMRSYIAKNGQAGLDLK
jgi:hypothetical protein